MTMTIQKQLIASLKWILGDNKKVILGIITPLKTEKTQTMMLKYLQENHNNKDLMRQDKLIKTALKIADSSFSNNKINTLKKDE